MRFTQKWILNQDRSSILLWAPEERPPVVARVRLETVREINGESKIDCRSWADAEPNISILIDVACRLLSAGHFIDEQGIRIVEISSADLIPEKARFRHVADIRPGFMDRTGRIR